jgi:GNAT superfamily N-acetyltransferase
VAALQPRRTTTHRPDPFESKSPANPDCRKDLNIVVVAPDGNDVSYACLWYVPENRVAHVEPVATDPAHRRLGLGKAVAPEAIGRTSDLGAAVAWGARTSPSASTWALRSSPARRSGTTRPDTIAGRDVKAHLRHR